VPEKGRKAGESTLRLSYVWLYVKDTERSLRFYGDVLGLKTVETFPHGALLNGGGVLLGIHQEEGDRKSQPGGTVINLTTKNIKNKCLALQRKGIKFLTGIQKAGYGQVASFRDPDGYVLELWQPP
jgi:predicted enzyme related to lactoylglutathione lyase